MTRRSAGQIRSRHLLAVIAAAVLVAGFAAPAGAEEDRSYRIADVAIDAELTADGDLVVAEDRTFAYDGTFRGAFYQLPLRGVDAVTGFALTDSTGVTYREGDADAEEPGTYAFTGEDPFEVTWWYAEPATDEERTFTLSYTLEGVGQRHEDAAQLYVQWVGEGWDVPTDRLVANVRLPSPPGEPLVAGQNLQVFAHGPRNATVEQVEPSVVRTAVDDLPPGTFLELRALMPPDALPEVESDGREVRDAVLAEERCLAVAADADRARARGEEPVEDCELHAERKLAATVGLGLVLLAASAGWLWMFLRHGREHPLPQDLPPAELAPPSADPPALVEWLQRWGTIGDRAFVATLMDLARRGIVQLRRELAPDETDEVGEVLTIREVPGAAPADPLDAGVLGLLRRAGGGRDAVTQRQLEEWVADHREDAYAWWKEWSAEVNRAGRARGWIEPRGWMGWSAVLGIALVLLGAGGALLGARWWIAVPAIAAGVVFAGASPLLRRRSREGRVLHERWRRFGAFLRETSAHPARSPDALALWGDVLPYAAALGLADVVVRQLDAGLTDEQRSMVGAGWYPLYLYGSSGSRTSTEPAMTSGFAAISALPAATIASNPASSGAGGGAAGGGGAGAGGSGGGAF